MTGCSPTLFGRRSWPPAGDRGLRRAAEGLPVTRGWCTALFRARRSAPHWIALPPCVIQAARQHRLSGRGRLRRRRRRGGRAGLPGSDRGLGPPRRSRRRGIRPLEVSVKLSALGQSLQRDGHKIARDERLDDLRRRATCRRVGDGGRREPHHHRFDAVDRARLASRLRLAGHGFAGLSAAHARRLRRIRGFRGPDPAVQGCLRRPASVAYRDAAEVTDPIWAAFGC